MTTLREAAQQALAWIHYHRRAYAIDEPIEERNLRAALAQQEQEQEQEPVADEREAMKAEYGRTDAGFTIAGIETTEGDKRLLALLVRALGSDHPAVDDLVGLLFSRRVKAPQPEPEQKPGGVCGRCGGWVCDPVLAQPLPDPADEYRKGFIDGQIDMRDRPEEQQEQEPVAWTDRELELIDGMIEVQLRHAAQCDAIANRPMAERQKGWDMERVALLRKIKNSPPRREWQSLSEEEIKACLRIPAGRDALTRLEFARAIEAKLKEKNNE